MYLLLSDGAVLSEGRQDSGMQSHVVSVRRDLKGLAPPEALWCPGRVPLL